MTDTITCPNCSAQLPSAASFCTSCGNRLTPGEPAGPPPSESTTSPPEPATEGTAAGAPPAYPPPDSTRVDAPGLHDATQVYTPPPAPTGPWEPAPGIAPVTNPGAPAAPAGEWGQPQSSPPGQPLAPPPGGWGQPAAPPQQQWQTPADATVASARADGSSSDGSPIGAALAVLGGALAIAGTFLVWVTNNATDSGLSGWDLTSGDKGFLVGGRLLTLDSPDPYIIVALGVVAVVVGALLFTGTARNVMRLVAVVTGVAIVGLLARDWTTMASVISDNAPTSFEISAAPGFYLVGAGGVLTALAALLPAKK